MPKLLRFPFLLVYLLFLALLLGVAAPVVEDQSEEQTGEPPWAPNWGVPEGFSITMDTDGYDLPSAIAFIPEPGPGPKDPLYFVTELRGAIKVVTNDRTVYTFAEDFFATDAGRGLEDFTDEFGLGSICLAPEQGYVFVTFTHYIGNKLFNNIGRFETRPGAFAIEPGDYVDYPEIFAEYRTDPSHQIGNCEVHEGYLYVSIGDGLNQETPPIGIDSLRGKVLRFTLDGEPAPANPFYDLSDENAAGDYVWAYGFRNPFGLEVVDGRVFVAENGRAVDRFAEIRAGEDYLWDGSDFSLGARAAAVFSPSIGPAQLEFYPQGLGILPAEYDNSFFIAMTGRNKGILNVHYDFEQNLVSAPPGFFLLYLGPTNPKYEGIVTGLALGPDGVYFAPMTPRETATGTVFKISYDPANAHPYRTDDISNPATLLVTFDCLGCHSIGGEGGAFGPSLDRDPLVARLDERLNSQAYLDTLDQVDQLDEEPFTAYANARERVRQAEGLEKVRTWLYYHLMEPKFDNPNAQMPNLGISNDEAELLANYLIATPEAEPSETGETPETPAAQPTAESETASTDAGGLTGFLASFPKARYRYVVVMFVVGLALGSGLTLWWSKRKKQS